MATTPTGINTNRTPPSSPVIFGPINFDNLNESWCDIHYKSGCSSTGSISHLNHTVNPEILEKLLQEAQREALSPPLALAPLSSSQVSFVHSLAHPTATCLILSSTNVAMVVPSESSALNAPVVSSTLTHSANASSFHCSQCVVYRQQIDILLEKQREQEKQIGTLKRRFVTEIELKTPELLASPASSSSPATSSPASPASYCSRRQTIITTTDINSTSVDGLLDTVQTTDWSKYWASRPQTQPPKEWNFVHPNSAKAKLAMNAPTANDETVDANNSLENEKITSKLFANHRAIGKLLFTHMASLIVGATLMFLVFRRHLNSPSEPIYYF